MNKKLLSKNNIIALSILATLVTTSVLLWVFWVSPTVVTAPDEDYAPETTTTAETEQDYEISVDLLGINTATTTAAVTTAEETIETTIPETEIPEVTTAVTTAEVIIQTLAPVNTLSEEEKYVIENFDVEVEVPETTVVIDTSKPSDAQGINEYGYYYKIVNGQEYVWENLFKEWMEFNRDGTVEVMDVESNGNKLAGY